MLFFFSFPFLLPFFFCFFFILSPAIAANSSSCFPENFVCGNRRLDIEFPFFTNASSNPCQGFHLITCIDFVPVVRFYQDNYLFPVREISYHDSTIIIQDLRLSAYFRGSDCDFVYVFRNPVPKFNFTAVSLSQTSGESFFDCKRSYDFSHDAFLVNYSLSLCRNYSLYYSIDKGDQSYGSVPGSCKASQDLWFYWKLSYGIGKNHGGTSLLAAGFSPLWEGGGASCFTCKITGGDCRGGANDPACSCRNSCHRKKSDKGIVIGVSVCGVVFLLACFLCFIHLLRCRRRRQDGNQQPSASSTLLSYDSSKARLQLSEKESGIACYRYQTHVFSYEELGEATNSFDLAMQIADGGFGTVYRGKLRDGRAVAVKRLFESNFKRAEQFANEVVILSRLRHQNLVSLYGCTSRNSRELLLVYEYVPNGTVADHLHGSRAGERRLTWPLRLSIAIETAAALAYLHAVDPPIIHRDVKTGNILLDAEFHVKVADFGLSRLFPPDGATHISTGPQGTPGYLDPEYHQYYQLTDRSDVFSFGVVLAELISSKPAVDLGRGRSDINLSAMVVNRIQSGNLEELVDRTLGFDSDPETRKMMRLVGELAFRCVQREREMRPAIKEVLEVLRGIQSGWLKTADPAEKFVERMVVDGGMDKDGQPLSPDSVTEKWVSRSSTPNSIH
ncbi:putative serine/threonine-protein kinase [Apostasia shenzhenica]|uniref:Putative serine/threonine-protein kinase n=1 Tax=Apostasia shenzhenica TaxID=1088818 RepID=A0A2I0BBW0_9ASPA|nr:putative serine/threonine-protein kinase [Apostasia shenzhenica]